MSEVDTLEGQLEEAKHTVKRNEALERLLNNADFREVIVNRFSRDDAAAYAQESADPLLTPEQRQDALNLAQAPGHLKRWLSIQLKVAQTAKNNIPEIEAALDEERNLGEHN